MNIKIGMKIKALRLRDGRKQEDLANAIGVSSQAVSRWEKNGGYPDLELIPSIANYFNISIDELFGYSSERQEKLNRILKKADQEILTQDDLTGCIEMLHAAVDEFPSEPLILMKLGYALDLYGWKLHGARGYITDESDYVHEDVEFNSHNNYWQEEIKILEKVLTMEIPSEDHDRIIKMLVEIYTKTGAAEKAKALALKQNSIVACRETLLPRATGTEERDRYLGELILALLTELDESIVSSVSTKVSCYTSSTSSDILIFLAQFYESVFSDGKCGIFHKHIGKLYLLSALFDARNDNLDRAAESFKKGVVHFNAFQSINTKEEYQYSAPLFSKVTVPLETLSSVSINDLEWLFNSLPDALRERLRHDPQFSVYFC